MPLPPTLWRRLAPAVLATLAAACQAPLLPTAPDAALGHDREQREQIEQLLYLAATEPPPFSHRHRLAAAKLLQSGGQHQLAHQLLSAMAPHQLEDSDFSTFTIQHARLLIELGDTREALRALYQDRVSQILPQQLPQRRAEILMLRGYGRVLNGQGSAALRALAHAEPLLLSPDQALLRQAIWELLIHTPREQLQQPLQAPPLIVEAPTLRGWLELALLCRDYDSSPGQQVASLSRWRQRWPDHPAALAPPPSARLLAQQPPPPRSIALFLPLSGELAEIGTAVQNGILAAWYADRAHNVAPPTLHVVDTGATDDLAATYQRVAAEGIDLVIGPLHRDRIRVVFSQERLPTPVLALNQIDASGAPDNSYQFGLGASAEVRQVVASARARGWRNALVFRPQRNWAQQLGAEFSALWLSGAADSRVVAELEYQNERRLSAVVEKSLLLRQSKQRSQELRAVLGQRFHSEPRRRQDVDFVLLLASPATGRLLKPMLQFHRADALPVLALSRIHDGRNAPERNSDLNGVLFPELPWLLEDSALRESVEALRAPPELQRMHALGSGAYRLAQWLPRMRADRRLQLYGPTGLLQLDDSGRIQRRMSWATMRNGRPQALPSRAALAPLARTLDAVQEAR